MDGAAGALLHRQTPDHPPYSEMVQAAIRSLSESSGSTESSISDYIQSHYTGLPWAHARLLPYYLRKLTAAGEISVASPGRFGLPSPSHPPNPDSNPNPDPPRRRRGRPRKYPIPVPGPLGPPASGPPPVRRGRGRPRKDSATARPRLILRLKRNSDQGDAGGGGGWCLVEGGVETGGDVAARSDGEQLMAPLPQADELVLEGEEEASMRPLSIIFAAGEERSVGGEVAAPPLLLPDPAEVRQEENEPMVVEEEGGSVQPPSDIAATGEGERPDGGEVAVRLPLADPVHEVGNEANEPVMDEEEELVQPSSDVPAAGEQETSKGEEEATVPPLPLPDPAEVQDEVEEEVKGSERLPLGIDAGEKEVSAGSQQEAVMVPPLLVCASDHEVRNEASEPDQSEKEDGSVLPLLLPPPPLPSAVAPAGGKAGVFGKLRKAVAKRARRLWFEG